VDLPSRILELLDDLPARAFLAVREYAVVTIMTPRSFLDVLGS
jgi:hypothetical protein